MPGLVDKQDYDLDDNSLEGRQVETRQEFKLAVLIHGSGVLLYRG